MSNRLDRETVRAASPLLDVIAEHLKQTPVIEGREAKFRCPFHEDRSPSLRANAEKGTWYCDPCHVGGDVFEFVQRAQRCDFPGALRSLAERGGVTTDGRNNSTVLAAYDYCDETGELLYQVCRMAPRHGKGKDFRQRRPDGHGGWIWNLQGVRRVLFGLAELRGQEIVYVAEGEKDALRLRTLGLPATTNPAGAGKWTSDYAEQLKAQAVRSVVVFPDNDPVGQAHADEVARSCTAAGLQVKVVTLPEIASISVKGADVSDWLDAGYTREDLVAATAAARPYSSTQGQVRDHGPSGPTAVMVRLSDVVPQPISWYWAGRIPLGKLSIICGDPGMGKSWISLDIAARGSTGREWPDGGRPPTSDVILLSAEDAPDDTIRPRLDGLGADVTRVHAFTQVLDEGLRMPVLSRDLDLLEGAIAKTGAKLVVIDPISAYLGSVDSHRDAEVRSVLAPVANLAARTGTAIVVVMHLGKGQQRPALYRAIGSIAFVAAARLVLAVAPHPEDETRRVLTPVKSNICVPAPTLSYQLLDGRLVWDPEPVIGVDADALLGGGTREDMAEAESADQWLLDVLDGGTVSVRELQQQAKSAGIGWRSVERAKARLGIENKKVGFGSDSRWVWRLKQRGQTPPKATTREEVAVFEAEPVKSSPIAGVESKTANTERVADFVAAFDGEAGDALRF